MWERTRPIRAICSLILAFILFGFAGTIIFGKVEFAGPIIVRLIAYVVAVFSLWLSARAGWWGVRNIIAGNDEDF